MAWYRTGTVAVTASGMAVTGTGTMFAAHVRVGDGFVGPDGRMYEVTNVASETVISIFPAYQGATATGQAYAIIPVQGYPKLLADRAGGLINEVGLLPGRVDGIEEGLGTASAANLVGSQNDSAAGRVPTNGWMGLGIPRIRTNFNSELQPVGNGFSFLRTLVSGTISDPGYLIEMLSDRPDEFHQLLKLQETGALLHRQRLAGVTGNWRTLFDTQNCSVSTNSNGVVMRFANGIQICMRSLIPLEFRNSSNLGAVWTYPASFASVNPVAFANLVSGDLAIGRELRQIGAYSVSLSSAQVAVLSQSQFVTADTTRGTLQAIAVGVYQ